MEHLSLQRHLKSARHHLSIKTNGPSHRDIRKRFEELYLVQKNSHQPLPPIHHRIRQMTKINLRDISPIGEADTSGFRDRVIDLL
ncbi:hypothetical protein CEXT_740421 [Caerostris extrusa]|uniref:Uncharacterized protein n=1 Tax=Caerostris extrusa TaxID=172846 RepID=A0AAV4XKM2_CAEEX|nr:hypothetical protein CEXT_740421 [Caerostris extrusa]